MPDNISTPRFVRGSRVQLRSPAEIAELADGWPTCCFKHTALMTLAKHDEYGTVVRVVRQEDVPNTADMCGKTVAGVMFDFYTGGILADRWRIALMTPTVLIIPVDALKLLPREEDPQYTAEEREEMTNPSWTPDVSLTTCAYCRAYTGPLPSGRWKNADIIHTCNCGAYLVAHEDEDINGTYNWAEWLDAETYNRVYVDNANVEE